MLLSADLLGGGRTFLNGIGSEGDTLPGSVLGVGVMVPSSGRARGNL